VRERGRRKIEKGETVRVKESARERRVTERRGRNRKKGERMREKREGVVWVLKRK
jgi:hypothetical protein